MPNATHIIEASGPNAPPVNMSGPFILGVISGWLLVMMHDAIDGHCFFVFEDLSLIAYPHNDTGFGLIRMHDSKLKPEDIFLQHVQQLPHFTSSYASTD